MDTQAIYGYGDSGPYGVWTTAQEGMPVPAGSVVFSVSADTWADYETAREFVDGMESYFEAMEAKAKRAKMAL